MSPYASPWDERRWRERLRGRGSSARVCALAPLDGGIGAVQYRLSREDCEDLAAGTPLAFHQELSRGGGVREEDAGRQSR